MKIGIDARFYGSIGKGLGRYTEKLIKNLEKIDHTNEYVIFLRRENFYDYVPKNPHFKKVLADYQWYSFAEQIFFPFLLKKQQFDLVHFPHFNVPIFWRKNFVLTVHDLILFHFPTIRNTTLNPLWYKIKYAAYRLTISLAIRRAKNIVAVSEFTKNDIARYYPWAIKKIVVTCEAGGEKDGIKEPKNEVGIGEKYDIIKPYIVYVGNAYPHKNLELLLDAFLALKKEGHETNLVLVGNEDYFYKRLKKYAEEKNMPGVNFLEKVDDEELSLIYKNARAYVFPSLYEGFGIPPLEAMAEGLPVASSDHQCMREVLGDAALFFDATDMEQIKNAIRRIVRDDALRATLINKGTQLIGKYSWEKMAKETLVVYEKIANTPCD